MRREVASAQFVFFLGQHDDGAAFGSLVGQRGELRGVGHLGFGDSRGRHEFGGLAVAEGNRAGLVEQQRVHVAGGLDRAAGHGENVVLDQAVHAGDADGRKQAANRGGNQADQQRDQNEDGLRRSGINGERLQRDDGQQEDDGESSEQNVQRDFVRSLLPRGAFDQRDHAIEKGLAGIRGDLHFDEIAENARAAGDGRAVAASFANHRRRFAGDGRFVDRGHALDDLSVAGDEFSGDNRYQIAGAQLGARNFFDLAIGRDALGDGFRPRVPQRFRLRLAAAFRHGFGEVGKQDREPQPKGDLQVEAKVLVRMENQECGRDHAADLDHEHDGVSHHVARVELEQRTPGRAANEIHIPNRFAMACHRFLEGLSDVHEKVFKNGPQAQSREESERSQNQDDADQQQREQRRSNRKRSH